MKALLRMLLLLLLLLRGSAGLLLQDVAVLRELSVEQVSIMLHNATLSTRYAHATRAELGIFLASRSSPY
jgi:hypothetical protein